MNRLAEEKPKVSERTALAEDDTRHALLDAAERLFAEKGVDGSSVRDITGLAQANLGAINYYFGTKDRLVLEVFMRRIEPLNRDRLAELDVLEARAGQQPLNLEEILRALIEPVITNLTDEEAPAYSRLKLINRCYHEMNPELKYQLKERTHELLSRFDRALMRAVEGLTERTTFWLMTFTHGALIQMLNTWSGDHGPLPPGQETITPAESRELTRMLVTFAAAGIRASVRAGV